jgi:DNA processing protein
MSRLALVAFAADTNAHLLEAPRTPRFASFVRRFDEDAFRRTLETAGVAWLDRSDPGFPARLRSIHDPPLGLFVRGQGDRRLLEAPAVAVVGARSCSSYGAGVALAIGCTLAAAGVVVVSGLARGVDAAAHRGALDGGGRTVAVLGCGIDRDYPSGHASLAAAIAGGGLILSEYPPGVPPAPWRFPARNRIVAGLADATVVVEARERSGALITADFALEEGREVLAVPGEITSALSRGTNALLRLGAVPVTSEADVLAAIGIEIDESSGAATPEKLTLDSTAEAVRAIVTDAPSAPDEIVRATGLTSAAVGAALSELELLGLVAATDGLYRAVMPQT